MNEPFDELVRDAAALHLRVLSAYRHTRGVAAPLAAPPESIDLLPARVKEAVRKQRSTRLPYATDREVVMDELVRASQDLLVQVERARPWPCPPWSKRGGTRQGAVPRRRFLTHGFTVTGDGPARTLLINAPAGFAEVISELGTATEQLTLPDSEVVLPDPDRLAAISEAHGIHRAE